MPRTIVTQKGRAAGAAAGWRSNAAVLLALVAVTTISRWIVLGDPLVRIDEQFYLLVGDRLLHGAIPYVDIWDRKPIGLFLLFAALRLLGGDGVWQYQIAAIGCVSVTAFILYGMAKRVARPGGAFAIACLYALALDCASGEGGQAPVWYNLPVAAAVAILLSARSRPDSLRGDFRRAGAASMALFGIALQIKYSVLFEGLFTGITLIALSLRRGRPIAALAVDMLLWIGLAALPTLIAAGAYAALGHFHDWLFANAISILQRGAEPPAVMAKRLAAIAAIVAPFILAIALRRLLGAEPASATARADLRIVDGWAASALLGVLIFGTWYDHYALPLFAPLAVAAAPLAASRPGRRYLAALLAIVAVYGQIALHRTLRNQGDAALLARMTVAAQDDASCLFLYDGPTALYRTTGSCLPTSHIFPSHLQAANEIGATGIDQVAEIRRIMAMRPHRVVSIEPAYPGENPLARAALYAVLTRDYRVIGRYGGGQRRYAIYGLRPDRGDRH